MKWAELPVPQTSQVTSTSSTKELICAEIISLSLSLSTSHSVYFVQLLWPLYHFINGLLMQNVTRSVQASFYLYSFTCCWVQHMVSTDFTSQLIVSDDMFKMLSN